MHHKRIWQGRQGRVKRAVTARHRGFLVLAPVIATATFVTACGGTSDGGGSAADAGTLTLGSWQWQEPRRGKALEAAVTKFQTVNEKATVEKLFIPRASYENTLKTQLGAKGGPDIFLISDSLFPELADAGLLEPLDDVIRDKTALNATNKAGVWKDEQLAVTWEVVNYAFFWNKDILAKAGVQPPTTPEELVTASQQIKKATGVTGFAVRSQMNEELPWWVDFANWPYGFDGGWSDGKKLTINRPENIAAVKALKAVYDSGSFAVGDDASTFRQKFKEGKVAMMIDNSATVDTLVHQNTVVPSTSVAASALPFPGEKSAHVGTLIGINANSKNKELAKEWLRWMLTDEGQKAMSSALGVSSVATDLETPADLVKANPWLPAFRAQAANSANPLIPGFELQTARIRPIILTQVARVLSQDADPAEALDQAQRAAEKISR